MSASFLHRPVRVIYRRESYCGRPGYTWTALDAQVTHVVVGTGWSAGKRRDAEQMYAQAARENGWIDASARAERMKGAA